MMSKIYEVDASTGNVIERDMTTEEQAAYDAQEAEWLSSAYDRAYAEVELLRKSAYQVEADPLYFKWQAGEGTEAEWLAKRADISARYPYPVAPTKK